MKNWLAECVKAPNSSIWPIPSSGLPVTGGQPPPVYTMTDSFGAFGWQKNGNCITCTAEFTAMLAGRADPWPVKAFRGEGIVAFTRYLTNYVRLGFEEPKPEDPGYSAWPPVAARPTKSAIVIVGWFANELCTSVWKNSKGEVVPEPPAGKKWKWEPKPVQHIAFAEPDDDFTAQVRKFIRVVSSFKYPIIVGAGAGEDWRMHGPDSWDQGVA